MTRPAVGVGDMSARVSIVIPTWNQKDLLIECLESIETQTFRDFEVVVVDDASTDSTVAEVRSRFPHVRVVTMPVNRGFCVAVNAGIRESSGAYVFLLNNDMTLDGHCLERLLDRAETSDAAMFAPLVVWKSDPEIVYSAGDLQRVDGRPESIGFRRPLRECTFVDEVFGVSAGAALYRREIFEKVGLFDERFIAYFEDGDLNFRARLMGYSACFVRGALAQHVGSASLGGKTWWRTRQCFRNHALLIVKNMPAQLIVRNFPAVVLERVRGIRRLISSARAEFGLVRALASIPAVLWEILCVLPHALVERNRIQRNRVLSPAQLNALLTHPVKTQ